MDIKCRKMWEEFIEIYRDHPCLWDSKSKDYSNRVKKQVAYETLLEKFREMFPEASELEMKKKVNNMRTCFRREFKKVIESKRMSGGDVYQPVLWYFNLLLFTVTDEEEMRMFTETEQESADNLSVLRAAKRSSPYRTEPETTVKIERLSLSSLNNNVKRPKYQRAETDMLSESTTFNLGTLKNGQDEVEDDCDRYGKILANKLRLLPITDRIQVMYEIDGLFIRRYTETETTPNNVTSQSYFEEKRINLTDAERDLILEDDEKSCPSENDSEEIPDK